MLREAEKTPSCYKMETPIIKSFEQIPAALQWIVDEVKYLREFITTIPNTSQPAPPPANEYITRKEAAAMLHLSLNTLDTYSQEGKLKAYRIGNRILYKAGEINEALRLMKPSKITA